MLHLTHGIVLKTLRFSETSVIAHIYTEKFGRLAYIINGVHAPKSKFKPALLQVLTPLDMVSYYKEQKNLQRLSEIKPLILLQSIPFNIIKSSIVIFLSEVLYRVLQESESNPPLFQFLLHAIIHLDQSTDSLSNFPIVFLIQLSAYLGFFPDNNFFYTERAIFDLQEGNFTHRLPDHPHHFGLPLSEAFAKALHTPLHEAHCLVITPSQRKALLHTLLHYYQLHISGFSETKSLKILEEIMA